ncbi:hypothetical protein [Kitasatospora terrestris]|uniref:hypothetical protein n=1 Tax=Kitasatospora terrestris TaxID=258051 RepID=UPI0031F1C055
MADTVKEQAAQVAGEVGAQARDLLAEAREQVQRQAHEQTGRLAENVRRLAHELRDMADHGKPDSTATAAVAQLADGGRRMADHLERRGPDGLLEDVQGFARRRPGLFLAGAALAGFAVGRTAKGAASAENADRTEQRPPGGERAYPPPVPAAAPAPVPPPVASGPSGPGHGAALDDGVYAASRPPHAPAASAQDALYGRRQPPAQGV